jgi:tetratricopeptide (TPR) repeat protein
VAAPAAAVVGCLGTRTGRKWPAARARLVALALLVPAFVLALAEHDRTWSHRDALDRAVLAGIRDGNELLRDRPLDGDLHIALARRAFEAGDLGTALARARTATARLPQSMDAWLVEASVLAARGEATAARDATREGLDRLVDPADPALMAWLLDRYPTPSGLAAVVPRKRRAWTKLMEPLLSTAPAHADALAAAWSQDHPEDPLPHYYRAAVAERGGRAALALHHARLARSLDPSPATVHVAVVRALGMFAPPRTDDIIDALEQGLTRLDDDDDAGRGVLEELLLSQLLRRGQAGDLARARQIAVGLLRRPAQDRDTRRRREKLVRAAAATGTRP